MKWGISNKGATPKTKRLSLIRRYTAPLFLFSVINWCLFYPLNYPRRTEPFSFLFVRWQTCF